MSTALLVIDVQQAMSAGEWAAFQVDRVIDNINGLIARARESGAPVIFIQHEEGEGPLQYGTEPWQLASTLAVKDGDIRVRKTTPDSFHRTELQDILQQRGCDKLVVCGMQSDFCVDTTTRSALARGYPVTLVADGHTTLDNGVLKAEQITAHHNETLGNMTSFGVRVTVAPAKDVRL